MRIGTKVIARHSGPLTRASVPTASQYLPAEPSTPRIRADRIPQSAVSQSRKWNLRERHGPQSVADAMRSGDTFRPPSHRLPPKRGESRDDETIGGFVSGTVSGETAGFAGLLGCFVSVAVSRDERDERAPIVSGGETARNRVISAPRSLRARPV